jgi:type III restriction enzyme
MVVDCIRLRRYSAAMSLQVVIENPVINSPFEEPRRHFKFDDEGITDEIVSDRRPSSHFIPIAQPRKRGKEAQQTFEGWTADRIEPNKTVNQIRQRVKLWREGKYPDVTRTTARLLEH